MMGLESKKSDADPADPTSVVDDKSCGISIIGKVSVVPGGKKANGIIRFRDSLDALTIYESRYKFLFFVRRLMSERWKERKEMANVAERKKKNSRSCLR